MVVWTIVNVEEWRIESAMPRTVLSPPMGQPLQPDLPNWAWHEYGMRVGFWRLLDCLEHFDVTATLAINGSVCQSYPRVANAALEAGWEFMGHGFHQGPTHKIEDQPSAIARTIEAIRGFTGKAPRGWESPGLTETFETIDHLAAAGLEYVADWVLDDQPCEIATAHGPVLSIPYTVETNDIAMMALQQHESQINIFTISVVGMVFGVRNLFGGQGRATQTLVLVAVGIAIVATVAGATGDRALGPTSVGALLVAAAYIGGMKLVYDAGKAGAAADDAPGSSASALRAWGGFGLAGLAILAAAPLLASSSVGIGDATGLGSSFMGVLAVSIVTTLPEASVTFAAARRKSYGLVIGNIYGSCAFNLFVIPIADLFHTDGPLLGEMGSSHFVAAGAAIVLMSMGFLVIRSYQDRLISGLRRLVYVVPPTYVGALLWVFRESRS